MSEMRIVTSAAQLDYNKLWVEDSIGIRTGIVPVACIDFQVPGFAGYRMQAYANRQAVETTLATGRATFWSRKRNGLWTKGEESGNFLLVRAAFADCDADSLLLDVEAQGPTCHEGGETCFMFPEEERPL